MKDDGFRWFRATEEWLEARQALTCVASEAAAYDTVSADLRARAGEAYGRGKDDIAETLRKEADRFAEKAKGLHRLREQRLKELNLIDPGYGPQGEKGGKA